MEVTIEKDGNGNVVMIEPELQPGLTRRVFKRLPGGSLDWTSYQDWRLNKDRARWFGYGSKTLPESISALL